MPGLQRACRRIVRLRMGKGLRPRLDSRGLGSGCPHVWLEGFVSSIGHLTDSSLNLPDNARLANWETKWGV